MKSDLSKGVGSKQTPQSFVDGHSSTIVTGQKTFGEPPRIIPSPKNLSALSRQSEQLNYEFGNTFVTETILERQTPGLQKYYDRAFSQTDPIGARNNDKFGFDEPFILKAIGDRWGPGGAGVIDFGLVRGGIVTQAARTVADIQRISKFLVTPRGVAFSLKQDILQKMNSGGELSLGTIGGIINTKLGNKNKDELDSLLEEINTLHGNKHKGRELWWLAQAYYIIKDSKNSKICQKLAQDELYRKADRIRDKKIKQDYLDLPPLHKQIFMNIEDIFSTNKKDSPLEATDTKETNLFKFCPGCGFNNENLFKFCPGCGSSLLSE